MRIDNVRETDRSSSSRCLRSPGEYSHHHSSKNPHSCQREQHDVSAGGDLDHGLIVFCEPDCYRVATTQALPVLPLACPSSRNHLTSRRRRHRRPYGNVIAGLGTLLLLLLL